MATEIDAFIADFDRSYEELGIQFKSQFDDLDPYKLEIALLEGDKEHLLDELNHALATAHDNGKAVEYLKAENERLRKENELLRSLKQEPVDDTDLESLLKQLQEANESLARYKKMNDELTVSKEIAEKKALQERNLRLHTEKEKAAYANAFATSIGHFELWAKSKNIDSQQFNIYGV